MSRRVFLHRYLNIEYRFACMCKGKRRTLKAANDNGLSSISLPNFPIPNAIDRAYYCLPNNGRERRRGGDDPGVRTRRPGDAPASARPRPPRRRRPHPVGEEEDGSSRPSGQRARRAGWRRRDAGERE